MPDNPQDTSEVELRVHGTPHTGDGPDDKHRPRHRCEPTAGRLLEGRRRGGHDGRGACRVCSLNVGERPEGAGSEHICQISSRFTGSIRMWKASGLAAKQQISQLSLLCTEASYVCQGHAQLMSCSLKSPHLALLSVTAGAAPAPGVACAAGAAAIRPLDVATGVTASAAPQPLSAGLRKSFSGPRPPQHRQLRGAAASESSGRVAAGVRCRLRQIASTLRMVLLHN